MDKQNEILETTPVRINSDLVRFLRAYKTSTGTPIQRFIEDAIRTKIRRIPPKVIRTFNEDFTHYIKLK